MADVIYLGVVVIFFVLAYLLIAACDRIIGSDEHVTKSVTDSSEHPKPAA